MTKTRALVGAVMVLCLVAIVAVVVAIRAANHADHLATAIQAQRVTNTRGSCNDQNTRHDNTVAALNHLGDLSLHGHPTPAAKARLRASLAPIVLLIDALAPKRDCPAYVNAATGMR